MLADFDLAERELVSDLDPRVAQLDALRLCMPATVLSRMPHAAGKPFRHADLTTAYIHNPRRAPGLEVSRSSLLQRQFFQSSGPKLPTVAAHSQPPTPSAASPD
jgi:hypothetical protein